MYELLNNPYSFKDGKNLMMVVNECSIAVKADAVNGVRTYTNSTCAGDSK